MTPLSIASPPASLLPTPGAAAPLPADNTSASGSGLTTGNVKPPAPPTQPATGPGDPPVLSVAAVVVGEDDGFVDLVFTLSAAAPQAVSIGWQITGASGDLGTASGTVSFTAGALTQTVRITITDDGVGEAIENFLVTLANPVKLVLASTSTLISVVDDDAPIGAPVISVRDALVDESAGTATFVVVLDRPSAAAVSVNFATASSTATAGADFSARSGTLGFAAGETAKVVTVSLVNDTLAEAAERFDLVLSAPAGGSLGDARGTAVIGLSDRAVAATPQLRVSDLRVSEADGWVDVVVALSAPADDEVSVGWATAAGTALAGSDFGASAGTLRFQAGQTTAAVRLGLVDSSSAEASESFRFNLASPVGATLADGSAGITVIDNDTPGVRVLSHGFGSDAYRVLSTSDVIVESSGGGTDTVQASASYTLGDNVERLTLTGLSALSGTGNALPNTLTGNGGSNLLAGGSGNDTLSGGNGNDALDGGSGDDSLTGGTGNDSYVVGSNGDRINEATTSATEIDNVSASLNWTLGANLEALTLTGGGALSGTGNAAANRITGNTGNNLLTGAGGNDSLGGGSGNDTLAGDAGNDRLDGGAGNDSLVGGTGNDSYGVDHSADRISETTTNAGEIDSVTSSVTWALGSYLERLTLIGSNPVNGTGNALANTITGNAGNNKITAGAGNDTVSGGSGLDTFRFSSALNAGTNVDTVNSFVAADDALELENRVFTKLTATGVLSSSFFRADAAGIARDSNDHLLYETDTGLLRYDADGSGAGVAVLIARFTGAPTLTAADVFVT
jgi:Ca2+-binding RTX toxin-like protein